MNVLPAEVKGRQARLAGHPLALDKNYGALPDGARIEIGIRPEFVKVAVPAPGLLSAEIERIDDLGRSRFARLRLGDLKMAARMPNGLTIAGSTAGLVFDRAQIHVYADSRRVEGTA
jgi:glycerol transport system ATP-binding protein